MTVKVAKTLQYDLVVPEELQVGKLLNYVILETPPQVTNHGIAFDSFATGLTFSNTSLRPGDILYAFVGVDNGKIVTDIRTFPTSTGGRTDISIVHPSSILRGSGSFIADGFHVGDVVSVIGSVRDDGDGFIVVGLSDTDMEVGGGGFTGESAGARITVASITWKRTGFIGLTFEPTDNTITRAGGSFLDDGFQTTDSQISVYGTLDPITHISNDGTYELVNVSDSTLTLKGGPPHRQTTTGDITVDALWTKRFAVENAGSGNNNVASSLWFQPVPYNVDTPAAGNLINTFSKVTWNGSVDDSCICTWNVRGAKAIGRTAPHLPFDNNFAICFKAFGSPPAAIDWNTNQLNALVFCGRTAEFDNPFNDPSGGFNRIDFIANSGAFGFLGMVNGQRLALVPIGDTYDEHTNIASTGVTFVDAIAGTLGDRSDTVIMSGVQGTFGLTPFPLPPVHATFHHGTIVALLDIKMTMRNMAVVSNIELVPREITLRWSDDRGASWSNPIRKTLGGQGDYDVDVLFRRLGMSRDRVFEISWTVPVESSLTGCFLEADIAET